MFKNLIALKSNIRKKIIEENMNKLKIVLNVISTACIEKSILKMYYLVECTVKRFNCTILDNDKIRRVSHNIIKSENK